MRVSVVNRSKCVEPLLPSCVPDRKVYFFFPNCNFLIHESRLKMSLYYNLARQPSSSPPDWTVGSCTYTPARWTGGRCWTCPPHTSALRSSFLHNLTTMHFRDFLLVILGEHCFQIWVNLSLKQSTMFWYHFSGFKLVVYHDTSTHIKITNIVWKL